MNDPQKTELEVIAVKASQLKASGTLKQWVTTLSTIIISFSGVAASLLCLYSLPGESTGPFVGSLFYLISSITLCVYFILQWKADKMIEYRGSNEAGSKVIIRGSLSDKILKWAISVFAALFSILSTGIALICIYALPDKTVRPQAGILFLFSGFIVVSILTFTLWKNKPPGEHRYQKMAQNSKY